MSYRSCGRCRNWECNQRNNVDPTLTRWSLPKVRSVLHMQAFEGHTALHFAVADGAKVYNLWVKEKPDEIHFLRPLRSY